MIMIIMIIKLKTILIMDILLVILLQLLSL